jgi:xanthine/uracil/vitamin C permease (AzgA family)
MGPTWAITLGDAWQLGCIGAVVTPGLVSNPSAWTASTVDVNTVPTAAVTIPTIAAGQALVLSGLLTMPTIMQSDPKKSPEAMAKAFRSGVMAFTFVLIGLVLMPPSAPPVPLPITAPVH